MIKVLNDNVILGLSSVATAGKDTFCRILSTMVPTVRFALADELKLNIRDQILREYNIDVLSCTPEEKTRIRPLLVSYGKELRISSQGTYWTSRLEKTILDKIKNINKTAIVITDIRYDIFDKDEVYWLKNTLNGTLIHIERYSVNPDGSYSFIQAPNEDEAKNDPRIKKKADHLIQWPTASGDIDAQLSPYVKPFADKLQKLWNI